MLDSCLLVSFSSRFANYPWLIKCGQAICITVCMVKRRLLEGNAKIILPSRSDRSKTGILYIPADLVKDSSFPFEPDQEVVVRIDGRRLIVEELKS